MVESDKALRKILLAGHSRANALHARDWVGADAGRFEQLLGLFLEDAYRVVQRAAQVLSMLAETAPELLQPHLPLIVARMQEPDLPVAVKRNVVRLLQFTDIPEGLHGAVMNTCFDLLADANEAIAVRVFSMTVLANLAKQYAEIKPELKAIIEDGLARAPTPAFRSRATKILKAL